MIIDKNIRLEDINGAAVFCQMKDAFITGGDFFRGENGKMSLEKLQTENPTWNSDDIIYGLDRLQDISLSGIKYVHSVYSGKEIAEDVRKAQVKLIYMPAEKKKSDYFVLLLAGGAYGAVCTMVEALPVAAALNSRGISCFCLNYRTAVQEDFASGLFPKPVEDVASACRYIEENAALFGINGMPYAVCGFSAGAHLAALWGALAEDYGCKTPKALMLAYPLVSMKRMPDGKVKQYMLNGMFGSQYGDEDIRKYDASENICESYPRCYIVKAKDDTTVPQEDAESFAACLKAHNVPVSIEIGSCGGHGFGLGSATPLKGWTDRAVDWINEIE